MKLYEYQGKKLFKTYGIAVPKSERISPGKKRVSLRAPFFLKSQVLSGARKKHGGIVRVVRASEFRKASARLFVNAIGGERPRHLLAEEEVRCARELYISISYDTRTRSPVLVVSRRGGSRILPAVVFPIDPLFGLPDFTVRAAVAALEIPSGGHVSSVMHSLWELFSREHALVVEINPLFYFPDGRCVAGDAKVIIDPAHGAPEARRILPLGGDIAVLASGGGASLVNLDVLMKCGGRPAVYSEYSGNPSADVVRDLTKRVLSRPGLKGCWVVGGRANFTDIFETMRGFVEGLRRTSPRPTYPIVIRRDGPRQEEAFAFLRSAAKKYGYDLAMFGSETPMSESAKIIVARAYTQ
ncbi:MAG: hypothetical protein A3I44_03720 [Candidatus Sungbacteria bacterium RIFCSPLOWO2_02_FULL_51_17]|uniref:Uncharacterized protein n=1 Tax=Candidatus Sungbacteria bacterium RIFCSPHIGHO2_02_FULL_51_29 TaxID=1802273 RepID=A0A1G2KTS4_9BACT|nr:MAG: hypothetical protein A2676_03500 [Candidatus Sungbacteria bacterium RIFCSPHIGHO2_01_FULL_51_22]OHA01821.1 MAG: hypothetical protein A3C16_05905 [Candidatus Sungbacteria bacterium RIFCSPHIGHO2_02_FULL_51_29]OHA05352.1 MAG: hypothetical protein A3B29_02370 [Candidatus Sungbacteria bacterium RIFCSPLOWO2_01_FULL_51_34]OHA10496.1 MAG: hypothetical protein A3I44_03720 [Candidatus Sungbacteria bacterium RIFCSPLOWO2_02_FULL_51_17]